MVSRRLKKIKKGLTPRVFKNIMYTSVGFLNLRVTLTRGEVEALKHVKKAEEGIPRRERFN